MALPRDVNKFILAPDVFQERSAALTTYAICGFSSLGTLGMMVGVWAAVDKKRARDAASMLPRVYINTNLACFLTACVAGTFIPQGSRYSSRGLGRGGGVRVLEKAGPPPMDQPLYLCS